MKIVAWGTYDRGKPRTRILLRGLREQGADVTECHTDVWRGLEDKTQVRGRLSRVRIALRVLLAYPGLVLRYLTLPRHDVVLVAHPGHLDVLALAPWARLRGVPIVWDDFVPLWETVVADRSLVDAEGVLARLVWGVETCACRVAARIVLDTRTHTETFAADFPAARGKTAVVPVGVEPEVFDATRRGMVSRVVAGASDGGGPGTDPLEVLFYGQMIPLHGVATLVEAVRRTRPRAMDEDAFATRWTVIGSGQDDALWEPLLEDPEITHLVRIPWVDYESLVEHLQRADVGLGVFGEGQKASAVIPNKVFQILSAGRPLVTRDSPAIRELLQEGNGVYLIPPADPDALVDALRRVHEARAESSGAALHATVREWITPAAIGAEAIEVLLGLLPSREAGAE